MDQPATTLDRTKLNNYTLSVNLFGTLHQAKVVNEQRPQLIPELAHEIRNPLTNINLAVQMLQSLVSGDDQKLYLDIILRGSSRINDMVTDLLIPVRDDEMLPGKSSIHQLLDEVLAVTEDRIRLKNITVIKEYAVRDYGIVLNGEKMKIALTNIIINAIDAMPSQNGQLKLVTGVINGKWVIQIEDNGTGISKKNLENIFKPYFTNKPGGMGLGLSATRDILLSNHAGVEVQSEEGKGTRFILSFDRVSTAADMCEA